MNKLSALFLTLLVASTLFAAPVLADVFNQECSDSLWWSKKWCCQAGAVSGRYYWFWEVENKKAQYNEASKDLKDAKQLLNQDQEKLRKVLGINSKREKIIGFISGIIASLIAALIWKFLEIIF